MTQSCQQSQTADSGGKRVVTEDSYCNTAGICAGGGWYKEETVGWKGNRVWGLDKEEQARGWWGELFISGTWLQFHSGMMEIFCVAKPRVEGVW